MNKDQHKLYWSPMKSPAGVWFELADCFNDFCHYFQAEPTKCCDVLSRAKGGIFTGEFEDSKHFIQPLRKAYKSILKERFQLIEVAGNHFVHMNEPEIVAGIISAFLNKHQKPKASL